jgi:hypothetical protein
LGQERYKEKAMELNGPDFYWLHSPVDVKALYECSCGRSHGKWALFNGIVNDREVLEMKRSHALFNGCQASTSSGRRTYKEGSS